MKESQQNRANVRFSEEEYRKVSADAKAYGETIPNILKAVYFAKRLPQPSMHREDAERVLAALNRIGNNVNQIARQLNAGFRQGFNPALEQMRDALVSIRHYVLGFRGHGQDQVR